MKRVYQIAETGDRKTLTEFLVREGQGLLPFVELIADARMAVEEFIDMLGRASLEAVLQLSAGRVAGPLHQGKAGGEVRRHGSHPGVVCLWTQKVRVRKPRLRKKGGGKQAEVPIPAYEAMQSDAALGEKLSSILLRGVSTRNYEDVIPEMAETCGASKSSVSREFIEASAEQLQALAERRFDELDLLVAAIRRLTPGLSVRRRRCTGRETRAPKVPPEHGGSLAHAALALPEPPVSGHPASGRRSSSFSSRAILGSVARPRRSALVGW